MKIVSSLQHLKNLLENPVEFLTDSVKNFDSKEYIYLKIKKIFLCSVLFITCLLLISILFLAAFNPLDLEVDSNLLIARLLFKMLIVSVLFLYLFFLWSRWIFVYITKESPTDFSKNQLKLMWFYLFLIKIILFFIVCITSKVITIIPIYISVGLYFFLVVLIEYMCFNKLKPTNFINFIFFNIIIRGLITALGTAFLQLTFFIIFILIPIVRFLGTLM